MTIGYFLTYAIVAIVAGFFLMAPVAFVFDRMHWPIFNAWELAHGYFLLAWPALALVSFPLVALLGERLRRWMRGNDESRASR